jgi:opacity protein-like surface antigen
MIKKILASTLACTFLLANPGTDYSPTVPEKKDYDFKQYYVGAGLNATQSHIDGAYSWESGYPGTFHNAGMTLIGGYKVYESETGDFKGVIEARYGRSGFFEGSEDIETRYFGVYGKPYYRVHRNGLLYGIVGITNVAYKNSGVLGKTVSSTGLSIGVGYEVQMTKSITLFTDYVYTDSSTYTTVFQEPVNFDVITVGFKYRF